jgi:hypothetical protein
MTIQLLGAGFEESDSHCHSRLFSSFSETARTKAFHCRTPRSLVRAAAQVRISVLFADLRGGHAAVG